MEVEFMGGDGQEPIEVELSCEEKINDMLYLVQVGDLVPREVRYLGRNDEHKVCLLSVDDLTGVFSFPTASILLLT